jgi:ABC-type phosphate/phosphonate transport system substrate-binding protein
MPPLLHGEAVRRGAHLVALCSRQGLVTYRSALLVNKSRKIQTIADLRGSGARAAWTDPRSSSGYLVPRQYLIDGGIDPARDLLSEQFFGSARAACIAVMTDHADLLARPIKEDWAQNHPAILADANSLRAGAADMLRVIGVTATIPADGFLLGPHVPPEFAGKVVSTLLAFHELAPGKDMLEKLLAADQLVPPPVTAAADRHS